MSESLPIPRDSVTKRDKIHRLLSEGHHSAKDIARIVGTTEQYVWKEKSKLKTAGFMIQRDTQIISRSSQVNIYNNNSLLNVPRLDADGLRKLYGELLTGKKPQEIIAENGFHPELVERENQRFQRLVQNDVDSLQNRLFRHIQEDLRNTNNLTIKSLFEKYTKDGKLTIEEFIHLTQLLLEERYRLGKISAMGDLVNGNLPEGWEAELCLNCNKPIRGCIKDAKGLRIIISNDSTPLLHSSWGVSCP
jgi:biotin operon repressor